MDDWEMDRYTEGCFSPLNHHSPSFLSSEALKSYWPTLPGCSQGVSIFHQYPSPGASRTHGQAVLLWPAWQCRVVRAGVAPPLPSLPHTQQQSTWPLPARLHWPRLQCRQLSGVHSELWCASSTTSKERAMTHRRNLHRHQCGLCRDGGGGLWQHPGWQAAEARCVSKAQWLGPWQGVGRERAWSPPGRQQLLCFNLAAQPGFHHCELRVSLQEMKVGRLQMAGGSHSALLSTLLLLIHLILKTALKGGDLIISPLQIRTLRSERKELARCDTTGTTKSLSIFSKTVVWQILWNPCCVPRPVLVTLR